MSGIICENTRFTESRDDDSSAQPLPAVGAYWIEEADYPAALKIFDDGNTLPRTGGPASRASARPCPRT
jgi:hypothetical protein